MPPIKKIILCSFLADSSCSSSSLLDWYNIDYTNTLEQTKRVIKYLSADERTQIIQTFTTAEGEYISLYLQELERANRIRHGSVFIENHDFSLYDINQDSLPELILYESSVGAGEHCHFYTTMNGALIKSGDNGRTNLYVNSDGGGAAYFARTGYYQIDKIELAENTLSITEIATGSVEEDPYPELDEFGYYNYEYLPFCPPAIPFALYTYNQNVIDN